MTYLAGSSLLAGGNKGPFAAIYRTPFSKSIFGVK